MTTSSLESYDLVPYRSGSFPQTHPRHLATIAFLLGMAPREAKSCRVLELGCAEGGNLIPMAVGLPDASFVGVDLSSKQIEYGQKTIRDYGLTNIELIHRDITKIDESFGKFDYIVAHGVFSWVPDSVRERLLKICNKNLEPHGLATVSYNAYPGGHIRNMVREQMIFRIKDLPQNQRAAEARRLLNFLIDCAKETNPTYLAILEWERNHVNDSLDHQLEHDILEENNDPFSISQFMERAEKHSLQYVGDANQASMFPRNFSADVFERLKEYSRNIIEMEQYMDYVRNRSFRQTLLCHADVKLDRNIDPSKVMQLSAGSSLKPVSANVDFTSDKIEHFKNVKGEEITSNMPIVKAAMNCLCNAWPGFVHFDELFRQARTVLERNGLTLDSDNLETEREKLASTFMMMYSKAVIELTISPPSCCPKPTAFPQSHEFCRRMAVDSETVINLRHETVKLTPLQRYLLPLLDGSQSCQTLTEKILTSNPDGKYFIEHVAHEIREPNFLMQQIARKVNQELGELTKYAFLCVEDRKEAA